jgi:hypothetical protein
MSKDKTAHSFAAAVLPPFQSVIVSAIVRSQSKLTQVVVNLHFPGFSRA